MILSINMNLAEGNHTRLQQALICLIDYISKAIDKEKMY